MRSFRNVLLVVILCFSFLPFLSQFEQAHAATSSSEIRGVWISYKDMEDLKMKNASEAVFRSKLATILKAAKKNKINRVYFQVRAFDDAAWKSKTFAASEYLSSRASRKRTAAKTYTYDPLSVVISESQKQGMQVEAWLNPYRITHYTYLDPATSYSTDRINRAITELKKYKLAGIHFDDYFYHSQGRYLKVSKYSRYKSSATGSYKWSRPSAAKKRAYVNKMIRSVYKNVHKKKGWIFGIAPQGNVDNCMSGGADVKTWMSSRSYVDYLAPQIYWTNKWGAMARTTMYSNRLAQFKKMNRTKRKLLVGMALYQTGTYSFFDRGWKKSSSNLASQTKLMRKAGGKGFILFRAADLKRSGAQKELKNLRKVLK